MSVFDTGNAGFNPNLEKIERSDPVSADFVNGLLYQLINNDVAIMEAASSMFSSKNDQALFLLNLHKDGKKYGVHFDDFDINPSSSGTRLNDAAGMVAYPSTDTERKQNDFEGVSVFYHIEVNGYVDSDGNFQVQYIDGIDDEFSRTDADVWCLYLPQWIKIIGNAINHDVIAQMKELNEKVDRVSKRQDEQDADRDRERAVDARRRILRTADEISNGDEHSEEYFNDMWDDINLYERYVKEHPNFANGKAVDAITLCTETYHEVKKKNKFK